MRVHAKWSPSGESVLRFDWNQQKESDYVTPYYRNYPWDGSSARLLSRAGLGEKNAPTDNRSCSLSLRRDSALHSIDAKISATRSKSVMGPNEIHTRRTSDLELFDAIISHSMARSSIRRPLR